MDFSGAVKQMMAAVRPRRDGDLVDRVNYCYTTILLIIFTLFTWTTSYIGSPIKCWYPAYFKGWWIEYANDYCYVQNTYFLRLHDTPPDNMFESIDTRQVIPLNATDRKNFDTVLPYYQWVPFMMFFQAMCFFCPIVLWRTMNEFSGICVNTILTTSYAYGNLAEENRRKALTKSAKFLYYSDAIEDKLYRDNALRYWTSHNYVSLLYIFIKFLYFFLTLIQLVILNDFLAMGSDRFWGFSIVNDLAHGRSWLESGRFPRVTLCDFEVRVLGNLHRHTVQCVLPLNMYNEKFYLFLWWWLLVLAFINFLSMIDWIFIYCTAPNRVKPMMRDILLKRQVEEDKEPFLSEGKDEPDAAMVNHFFDTLQPDALTLMKLIQSNGGDLPTREMTQIMFQLFAERHAFDRPGSDSTLEENLTSSPKTDSDKQGEKTPPVSYPRFPPEASAPPPPPQYTAEVEEDSSDSAEDGTEGVKQTEM